jgi:uncharacterized membrane protein (UPF0136 family)
MSTERRSTGDRRGSRLALRLPDRRTGFDRREAGGVLSWYRDRPGVIAATLAGILFLNLADYLLTLQALDRGAQEVNPIMAALFESDPSLALAFKLITAMVVAGIIWQLRRYRRILGVALIALGGFALLVVYQLGLVLTLA